MNHCSSIIVISPLLYLVSSKVYVTPDAAYLSSSIDITPFKTGLDQVTAIRTLIILRHLLSFLPSLDENWLFISHDMTWHCNGFCIVNYTEIWGQVPSSNHKTWQKLQKLIISTTFFRECLFGRLDINGLYDRHFSNKVWKYFHKMKY